MAFTSTIATQKTPANPVNITLGPEQGLPNAIKTVVLIAAMGPTGGPTGGGSVSGTESPYTQVTINNVGSVAAASAEVVTKFGDGSELANMVLAAVRANAAGPNFPPIKCIPLPEGATDFGGVDNNEALLVLDRVQGICYVATQFDGATDDTNREALLEEIEIMSGATRTSNAQYGSFGVMANTTEAIDDLPQTNTQYFVGIYLYDSEGNPYSVGELAAAGAAKMASNPVPFNGQDYIEIAGISAPENMNDWLTVGGGLESETVLNQGWTPLRVLPNSTVAFVRTVTGRLFQTDGVTAVTSYFDTQDFDTLYYFRQTIATRFAQPDFINQKASQDTARAAKGEVIRLMQVFEDQGMFQSVSELAELVVVQTNPSQRGRFDVYIPVNVVPNLHMIATDVEATTLFDQFTV